jgi:hypothetical protein
MPSNLIDINGKLIRDNLISKQHVSTYKGDDLDKLIDEVCEKVSLVTGINKNRFERPQVRHYKQGDYFNLHHDYFTFDISSETDPKVLENMRRGGNRVSTLIIYLNDEFEGGETFFPWLNQAVKPKTGSLLRFDYHYDDALPNVKTDHCGMGVENGEKWIMTIFVHETDRSTRIENPKSFDAERAFYSNPQDAVFELECGPEDDRRVLSVTLPANNDPSSAIILGMTGGIESTLLLYILAALNETQKVPYHILPINIIYWYAKNKNAVAPPAPETGLNIREITNWVKRKTESPHIDRLFGWVMETINEDQKVGFASGLQQVLDYEKYLHLYSYAPEYKQFFRFWKIKWAYAGVNEVPPPNALPSRTIARRIPITDPRIFAPFSNLQKHHIIDAVLQLELEELFEVVRKCKVPHKTLDEKCQNLWQCEERRWGFRKLGLYDLGNKYFTNNSTLGESNGKE